jgi:hypothetical protein
MIILTIICTLLGLALLALFYDAIRKVVRSTPKIERPVLKPDILLHEGPPARPGH